ncbi:porin, partial [Acinetobacter baumannii]|uniref:porin n=1 Tax=Acinetobacter baumannii TaxID=470 RepID=UPI0014894E59
AYTADFGQGITGSIAVEEETTASNGQSNLWNVTSFTASSSVNGAGAIVTTSAAANAAAALIQGNYGVQAWGGTRVPDITGAVRVDQA